MVYVLLCLLFHDFVFECDGDHRDLHVLTHSFPTRRSSDFVRAIPDYRQVPGNLGVRILERTEADVVHFQTLTFWSGIDAIRAFAGPDATDRKSTRLNSSH